jgi:hypothetical protein
MTAAKAAVRASPACVIAKSDAVQDIFHEGSEHLDLFRDDDDAWR